MIIIILESSVLWDARWFERRSTLMLLDGEREGRWEVKLVNVIVLYGHHQTLPIDEATDTDKILTLLKNIPLFFLFNYRSTLLTASYIHIYS